MAESDGARYTIVYRGIEGDSHSAQFVPHDLEEVEAQAIGIARGEEYILRRHSPGAPAGTSQYEFMHNMVRSLGLGNIVTRTMTIADVNIFRGHPQ